MALSVIERLRSAAAFHFAEYPGVTLSVSKLCSDAGVNRANAYARHSDLLRDLTRSSFRIKDEKIRKKQEDSDRRLNQLRSSNERLEREYKALLNLCIEQMAEIRSLRIKIADSKSVIPRKEA